MKVTLDRGPYDGFTVDTGTSEDDLPPLMHLPISSEVLDAINGESSGDVVCTERMAVYGQGSDGEYSILFTRDLFSDERYLALSWCEWTIRSIEECRNKEKT